MNYLIGRPDWYTSSVNSPDQLSSIADGGPDVPPDQPPTESTMLWIRCAPGVLFSSCLPSDSLTESSWSWRRTCTLGSASSCASCRAKARFFIDAVNEKCPKLRVAHYQRQDLALARVFPGVEAIQALLPADKPLVLDSDLSAADASIAPWLLFLSVRNTEVVGAAVRSDKFAPLCNYYQDVKEHPSVKSTYDEVRVTDR
jgi:glutathione S-transferase